MLIRWIVHNNQQNLTTLCRVEDQTDLERMDFYVSDSRLRGLT